MDETTVRIELGEGLVVGPDEILIVRIAPAVNGEVIVLTTHLADALRKLLGRRFLIIKGDVELAKVKREP